MRPRLKAPTLLLLLLPLLYFAAPASACTCGGTIQPCRAYAYASVVFVGVVTVKGGAAPDSPATRFRVEEAFLGVRGNEVAVTSGGTNCDYEFKVGERYLVYGYPTPDGAAVHTNICAGTAPLGEAGEHVAYLRGVAKSSVGGTFVGDVSRYFYDTRQNKWNDRPARGVQVILESGGRRFRSTTDAKGNFVVPGLPRGRYRVRTVPAANFSSVEISSREPRAAWELDLPDHGCVKNWFVFRPRGELSGQVSGVGRLPREDLWVEIIFADHPNTEENGLESAKVGPDGRFKFNFLPAGRYLVGFNLKTGPFRDYPFAEFYYPGVAARESATVISLGEGARVSGLKLPSPERVPESTVEGVAVWPDGKPAVGVSIQLNHPRTGWRDGNPVETDAHGRFSIKGIEGLTYELTALVHKGIPLVNSKPLVVKVRKVNRPVRLVVEVP